MSASALRRFLPIAAILGLGLALRLVLADVVFPNQGMSGDLGLFSSWAAVLARLGPGTFYASAPTANYPPGYLYVLWLVGRLGGGVGLLKLPAILADVAIGALLYVAGRRWFGERAGLLAAALYLFVPVTWYDSALWGQVDAVGSLPMLAAALLLAEGWSEPAAALAGVAVLVKPQDAVALVVVHPVLVRRHLLAIGSGPVPALFGSNGSAGPLGRFLAGQGPARLVTSGLALVGVVVLGLLPFDIVRFAPAPIADVPILAQLAGLVGLFASAAGQFTVLTANAFNAWALVGSPPLAALVGTGGSWTPDATTILPGIDAAALGTALLVATGLLISLGLLLRRDDRVAIVAGLALAAFAFYALPTRVHERYLLPFFAPAALLAAAWLPGALSYVGISVLNAANLHAVLAGSHVIGTGGPGDGGRGFSPGGLGPGGFGQGGFGPGGIGQGGGRPGSVVSAARSISLPFPDLISNSTAVTLIAVGQTLAFLALLAGWVVLLVRRPRPESRGAAAPGRPALAGVEGGAGRPGAIAVASPD